MLGMTGSHAGNVKPPVERPYEPFGRISRTQLILLLTARLERNRIAYEHQLAEAAAAGLAPPDAETGADGAAAGAHGSGFTDLPYGFDLEAFHAGNTVTVPAGFVTPMLAPAPTPGASGSGVVAAGRRSGTPVRSAAGSRPGSGLGSAGAAGAAGGSAAALTKAARGRLTPTGTPRVGSASATRDTRAIRLPEGLSEDTVPLVLDARTAAEFAVGHLYGAVSFPKLSIKRDQFTSEVWAFKHHEKRAIVVYGEQEWDDGEEVRATASIRSMFI
jgi:hypothetical protein